jgi:hypothetical protein
LQFIFPFITYLILLNDYLKHGNKDFGDFYLFLWNFDSIS